jgi:hypothetical protein
MPSKTKRPATSQSAEDDEAQSARFREAARKLGADKSSKKFEEAFQKIVPPSVRLEDD